MIGSVRSLDLYQPSQRTTVPDERHMETGRSVFLGSLTRAVVAFEQSQTPA